MNNLAPNSDELARLFSIKSILSSRISFPSMLIPNRIFVHHQHNPSFGFSSIFNTTKFFFNILQHYLTSIQFQQLIIHLVACSSLINNNSNKIQPTIRIIYIKAPFGFLPFLIQTKFCLHLT